MKLREAHIWWAPQYDANWKVSPYTGRVIVLPFGPESWEMHRRGYQADTGACLAIWREIPLDKLVMKLFAETASMVARDGVDPQQLHTELCKIEEYCWLLAEDVPGAPPYDDETWKPWDQLVREDAALMKKPPKQPPAPTEQSKRRERLKVQGGVRFRVLKRDGYRCQLCGTSAQDGSKLHIDHKVPRKTTGTNSMDNLWVLCADCNQSKSDATL